MVEEVTLGTLVSKFEEENVRHEMRYTIPEWRSLSPQDRAKEIAIERINKKIEYVKNLKEMKKI